MSSSSLDRRGFKRIPYHAPIEYLVGNDRGHGQVVDISLGGIRFDTAYPLLKQGESAKVLFVLGAESIELEVVCRYAAIGFGIGAEFINLSSDQTQRLQKIIGEEASP